MSIVQAIGLSILPNIGGFIGSFLTSNSIKTWYEVLANKFFYLPISFYTEKSENFYLYSLS